TVMKKILYILPLMAVTQFWAQEIPQKREGGHKDNNKFSQMYDLLATPNMFRTASGAPGPAYYQQQADYKMDIELDDKNTKIFGKETITYHNNAPEALEYLWVQLDQNINVKDSKSRLVESQRMDQAYKPDGFSRRYLEEPFQGGFNIEYVQ